MNRQILLHCYLMTKQWIFVQDFVTLICYDKSLGICAIYIGCSKIRDGVYFIFLKYCGLCRNWDMNNAFICEGRYGERHIYLRWRKYWYDFVYWIIWECLLCGMSFLPFGALACPTILVILISCNNIVMFLTCCSYNCVISLIGEVYR